MNVYTKIPDLQECTDWYLKNGRHMAHFIYLALNITFFALGAWTVTVFVLYRNSHKIVLGLEAGVGLSCMAIIGGLLLYYYAKNCGISIGFMPTAICLSGTLSTLVFFPQFTHKLLSIPISRPLKMFFYISAGIYSSAFLFIPKTMQYQMAGPFTSNLSSSIAITLAIVYGTVFYGTLGYCFVVGIAYGKKIGDKFLRRIRAGTFGLSLIFLPFLIIFSITGWLVASVLCLSLMFLCLSIINLYFSIFYSNEPTFFHNNSLSDQFIQLFQVSEREKEVVILLLDGMANKEIADKLHISVRTVENHLSSIYKKTETSGRVQLINLIRSNSI